jgi:outer membrane protein assembly factor BamB
VEPATGKIVWSTSLAGRSICWSSPTGADGKIYIMSLRGEVFILNAADGKLISQIPMAVEEEDIRSSIAAAHGNLFIRTNSKLYCVGK